jgi:hypothetical protein
MLGKAEQWRDPKALQRVYFPKNLIQPYPTLSNFIKLHPTSSN